MVTDIPLLIVLGSVTIALAIGAAHWTRSRRVIAGVASALTLIASAITLHQMVDPASTVTVSVPSPGSPSLPLQLAIRATGLDTSGDPVVRISAFNPRSSSIPLFRVKGVFEDRTRHQDLGTDTEYLAGNFSGLPDSGSLGPHQSAAPALLSVITTENLGADTLRVAIYWSDQPIGGWHYWKTVHFAASP